MRVCAGFLSCSLVFVIVGKNQIQGITSSMVLSLVLSCLLHKKCTVKKKNYFFKIGGGRGETFKRFNLDLSLGTKNKKG
jgi:hypothetical protein